MKWPIFELKKSEIGFICENKAWKTCLLSKDWRWRSSWFYDDSLLGCLRKN